MPEINLPTAMTQQEILELVQSIQSQFPISGGIDWSKYTKPFYGKYEPANSTGETVSIVDIQGSGYLDYAIVLGGHSSSANNCSIDVIMDGVPIFLSAPQTLSNYGALGILNVERMVSDMRIHPHGTTFQDVGSPGKVSLPASVPVLQNARGEVAYLSKPLFFKKSLQVRAKADANGRCVVYGVME